MKIDPPSDPPVRLPEERIALPEDCGLSVDMLDVDRLKSWSYQLDIHGADISHWAQVAFVVQWLSEFAGRLADAVRDVGALRQQNSDLLSDRAAILRELEEKGELLSILAKGKSPCGHWSTYTHTEDGGKHIECLQCGKEQAEAALARLTQELEALRTSLNLCEAHQPTAWEGDGTCVLCEAVRIDDERRRLTQERDRLREQLEAEGRASHDPHHPLISDLMVTVGAAFERRDERTAREAIARFWREVLERAALASLSRPAEQESPK